MILYFTVQSRLCSNGAQSPEATNTWPQATENILQVARPGDILVLVACFTQCTVKARL